MADVRKLQKYRLLGSTLVYPARIMTTYHSDLFFQRMPIPWTCYLIPGIWTQRNGAQLSFTLSDYSWECLPGSILTNRFIGFNKIVSISHRFQIGPILYQHMSKQIEFLGNRNSAPQVTKRSIFTILNETFQIVASFPHIYICVLSA